MQKSELQFKVSLRADPPAGGGAKQSRDWAGLPRRSPAKAGSLLAMTAISFSFLFFVIMPAQAQIPSPITGELGAEILGGGQEAAAYALHLSVDVLAAADARIYAAQLVRIALSFIGILFIALVAYGGALWFLSQGNEETIKKAKGVLTRGVVGLAIILSSYGLATLIQWGLVKATTEEVFWKAQDPSLLSSCGTLWSDYQNCLTEVGCSESQAKKFYKQWKKCVD